MIAINHTAFVKFCFGEWLTPTKQPLTPNETKVFNMVAAGFPITSIMKRMTISESRVKGLKKQLEAKGWL